MTISRTSFTDTQHDRFMEQGFLRLGKVLPADRGLRREVRWIIAERTLDLLDGVPQFLFLVGPDGDEHPLVEDVRAVLDGLVRRCGLVGAFL